MISLSGAGVICLSYLVLIDKMRLYRDEIKIEVSDSGVGAGELLRLCDKIKRMI